MLLHFRPVPLTGVCKTLALIGEEVGFVERYYHRATILVYP